MSSSLPDDLAQAAALLRAGRLGEARALLVEVVRREPRADQAWFLLSLAVEDARQQRDCLLRALQLNPKHGAARERLAELDEDQRESLPAPVPVPPAPRAPVLPPTTAAPSQLPFTARPAEPPLAQPPTVVEALRVRPAPTIPPPLAKASQPAAKPAPAWAFWVLLGLGSLAALMIATVAGLYWSGFFDPPPVAVVVVDQPTAITFPTL